MQMVQWKPELPMSKSLLIVIVVIDHQRWIGRRRIPLLSRIVKTQLQHLVLVFGLGQVLAQAKSGIILQELRKSRRATYGIQVLCLSLILVQQHRHSSRRFTRSGDLSVSTTGGKILAGCRTIYGKCHWQVSFVR